MKPETRQKLLVMIYKNGGRLVQGSDHRVVLLIPNGEDRQRKINAAMSRLGMIPGEVVTNTTGSTHLWMREYTGSWYVKGM